MLFTIEEDGADPSFIRRAYSNPYHFNKGEIASTYEVTYVEFLTQMPENNFQGDAQENRRLKELYTKGQIKIYSDPEWHLPDILNYLEDSSGMLVADAVVRCLDGPSPDAPETFEESFPHTRDIYPKDWIWHRRIRLFV